MGKWFRLIGPAFAALAWVGCAESGSGDVAARRVLENYAAALRAEDAERAWSMLSEDAKRETSFLAFQTWVRERPDEVRELADKLMRPQGPRREVTLVSVEEDAPVVVVHADGSYRVAISSVDRFSQATPELALRSFVRAVKKRRYDVLIRLAPKSERSRLTPLDLAEAFEGAERERILSLVRSIELALAAPSIERNVMQATFDLGAGASLRLRLEDGRWILEDYLP